MNKFLLSILFSMSFMLVFPQSIPEGARRLLTAYPKFIKKYDNNYLILVDGEKLVYDNLIATSEHDLLNNPYLADLFFYSYPQGDMREPREGEDPGRIRSEHLMKIMYGRSEREVRQNLTSIVWCPKLVGQKIMITTINDVHLQLQKVSSELDEHPELKKYLLGATTYNWRTISGTNRLSSHSFGTAIDLNVKFSNYWQWDCRCKDEKRALKYKNQIPALIVTIFEKHGFIWGGKWYHFDTMHFEYRPEMLVPPLKNSVNNLL